VKRPAILERLRGVQKSGGGWLAFCPAHDDQAKRSLSVKLADDGRTLVHCFTGCVTERVCAAVNMTLADLAPLSDSGQRRREVASYDYCDEHGSLVYQVVRFEPKDFRCRRPDGRGGWTWSLDGVRIVPYRLHELAEARRVYVAEGERDCDALAALGITTTTNHGGAGKWREEHTRALVAAAVPEVIVLRDNDRPGAAHQDSVAQRCAAAGLRVKRLELPGLPPLREKHGEDVSDWLASGHSLAELEKLADEAPVFTTPAGNAGPDTAPQITMTAEDGAITWPDGAGISFARVVEGSRGVSAEVSVGWQGRELHYGALNLLSTRSREDVIRKVAAVAVAGAPWREYLDDACRKMVVRMREGEPVMALHATPRPPEQSLVHPVLADGDTTVTFGPGGSGKSLYALLLELAVTTGCALPSGLRATRRCPVLVLDWESSRAAHEARLYELCRALGVTPPTTIYYKRMSGALSDSIRQIRSDVARLGVGLVRVDSLALAAGREPEGADASTRTMNELRTLGSHVARHVIAHVAKTGLDVRGTGHVYGSVFNENIPRNVYEIRRAADPVEDELVLAVYHNKANESRRRPPFGLRFILSPEEVPPAEKIITVSACPLGETPDLLARAPLSQQLKAALSNGAKTFPALAVELDAKEDTLDKALRRHPALFTRLPGEKPPYFWGLTQR
jgi:AAA domain-containing protein